MPRRVTVKAFRTSMMVAVTLAMGVFVASAQSLAEVAKKEKERRETNNQSATRVITDRELTYGYGGEPSTSSTVTVPGGVNEEGEGEASEGAGAEGQGAPEQDETTTQAYWRDKINAAKTKIAGIEQQIRDGDWGDGIRAGVDPRGMNNLNQRQQLEQQLAVARAELASIQAQGRQAGVPPGWLR